MIKKCIEEHGGANSSRPIKPIDAMTEDARYTSVDGHLFMINGWPRCPYCNGHPYGQEKGDYECDRPWRSPGACEAYGRSDMAFPDNCPLWKVKYD